MRVFTQKYFDRFQQGMGSGKAEEKKVFVKESGVERIKVDERLASRQVHNRERLSGLHVVDIERMILDIFRARATF